MLSSLKVENSDPPITSSDFRKFGQKVRDGQSLISTHGRMGLDKRLRLGVGNGRRDPKSKSGVIKDEGPCSWYSSGVLRSKLHPTGVQSPGVTRNFHIPTSPQGALQAQTTPVNRSSCADVSQPHKRPAWVEPRAKIPWTVTHEPRKNTTQHRRHH